MASIEILLLVFISFLQPFFKVSKPMVSQRFTFNIDCEHSSIDNGNTQNTITLTWIYEDGTTELTTIYPTQCQGILKYPSPQVKDLFAVQVRTNGSDAFFIDRAFLTSSETGELPFISWGIDGEYGYCFSLDETDADRTWKGIVGKRGCRPCHEFKVSKKRPKNFADKNTYEPDVVECHAKFNMPCVPSGITAAGGGKVTIDDFCPPRGKKSSARVTEDRNEVKNNFCATQFITSKKVLPLDELRKLHKSALSGNTADRLAFRNLGEGLKARFVGYVSSTTGTRNTGDGESVNCGYWMESWNDIHLELVENSNLISISDDQRAGTIYITEISPHYRPASWTVANLTKTYEGKIYPILIEGQLFFDDGHEAYGDIGAHPIEKRATICEIHPIYNIWVYNFETSGKIPEAVYQSAALDELSPQFKAQWIPLHQWVK